MRGESQVALSDNAYVHSLAGSGSAAGVVISTAPAGVVSADGAMVITGTGAGGGGSITIVAGQLALHNFANVLAETSGVGGGVDVSVGGSLTVDTGGSSAPRHPVWGMAEM